MLLDWGDRIEKVHAYFHGYDDRFNWFWLVL